MIESSFFKQYGIRLRTADLEADEFMDLLAGLMGDTPLGAIIQIRSEKDPDIIKHFTAEQKRIHKEWSKKEAMNIDEEEYNQAMERFKNIFKAMAK